MKNTFWLRICAILLSICTVMSSVTAVEIIKAYAMEEEGGDGEEDYGLDGQGGDGEEDYGLNGQGDILDADDDYQDEGGETGFDPDYNIPDPVVTPEPAPQPDPFDYNLVCYTPSISFGTIEKGCVLAPKQFSIVNVGQNTFPLTWEELDPNTAFNISCVSPDLNMDPGETVTFSLSPDYQHAAGSYVASYIFFSANDIRRHHTARVDVTVTVKDSEPYVTSVEIVPGSVTLPAGKSYTFSATVAGGNNYDPTVIWSLQGNQSVNTYIGSDGTLSVSPNEKAASFAVIATSMQDPSKNDRAVVNVTSVDYVVSVKADPSNGGAVAGGGAVKAGGSCSVSASPNNNFKFKGWYSGGSLITSDKQLYLDDINEDVNLIAKFERRSCYVRTSVNNGDAGTVTGSKQVEYGGKMTITAEANKGYSFAGFVENNKTISNASSIELNNITSDRNITAVFNRATCNVNVSVSPQDTGKYEGAGTYNKGGNVELTASAYDGYEFSGWTINGQMVSTDTKYRINNIQNDVNAVANFVKKSTPTYKLVSGIANQGGSIAPSGDFYVAQGGSVTYNILPQADYNIGAVIVDGKNIGAISSYTFNNVKGGHTITVSFEKKPAPVAPTPSTNTGSSTPKNSGSSTATPAAKKEQSSTKKTEYTKDTAAQGAVQEQKVVEVEFPQKVEELQGEDYEDDSFVAATEIKNDDSFVAMGVMAKHNIDEDTLRQLIEDDAVLPMLKEAFEEGTLQITVNNSYAEDTQETAAELYYQQPTLKNFEDVIAETLTKEEKLSVLKGTPISFNIDITENTETVDEGTKKLMQKKIGYKPVSYFDFMILKTSGGTTTAISNTAAELEVVVPIPEKYRKEGRKFFVIRNHNGVVDVLDDIGNDPASITFRTDRFSEYAIAYEAVNVNKLVLRVVIASFVSLILAIICFVNLVKYKRRERRAKM